jgi:hypothetical protein
MKIFIYLFFIYFYYFHFYFYYPLIFDKNNLLDSLIKLKLSTFLSPLIQFKNFIIEIPSFLYLIINKL